MAFPASGFEKVYRNSIDDVNIIKIKVSEYLNKKHEDHYLIFNLSGRKYDTTKFNNKVL
jgi:phosphatidylinositol-3,4,5-trisphosphate 3-phosphatase/dual-specificity protein phosphatase PTEN